MLSRLAKAIKRGFRGIGKKGYTLIEVAAVVAVSATLAAVVVPIAVDKTNEGKLVAAKNDCKAISGAISGFYKDTGFWPAFQGGAADSITAAKQIYYHILRSGSETEYAGSAAHDPLGVITLLSGIDIGHTLTDLLENHLVKDIPGGTPADGYRNNKVNWKGPYLESLASKRDPWGNNYLVYVKPMHTSSSGTTKQYGWILSAGPNGILQTTPTAKDLAGDDIGVMLYSYEVPKD